MKLTSVLLTFVPLLGLAEEEAPSVSLSRIYSAVSFDWDGDGVQDRAFLVEGNEEVDADLYLVRSNGQWEKHEAFAWSGGMLRRPRLELNEANSLVVITANDSIGRYRWESRTTMAWRDGQFVVAGYDHSAYDTLDLDYRLEISINYLTGKAVRNGKESRDEPKRIPVGKWKAPDLSE